MYVQPGAAAVADEPSDAQTTVQRFMCRHAPLDKQSSWDGQMLAIHLLGALDSEPNVAIGVAHNDKCLRCRHGMSTSIVSIPEPSVTHAASRQHVRNNTRPHLLN